MADQQQSSQRERIPQQEKERAQTKADIRHDHADAENRSQDNAAEKTVEQSYGFGY